MSHKGNRSNVIKLPWGRNAQLEFHATAAIISVIGIEDGEEPRIETSDEADLTVKETGNVTHVRIGASMERLPFFFAGGAVDLYLPRNVKARIGADAGTISVEGLKDCDVSVATSAGVVDVDDVHGRLKVRTGAGTIRADKLGGTIDLETAAGTVTLDIDALDAGEHRVRSSMGAVRVRLARGIDVRIDSRTSLGSVRTRYDSRPEGAAVLRLETDLGSVRVFEAGEDPEWQGERHALKEARRIEREARRAEREARREDRRAHREGFHVHAERVRRFWEQHVDAPPPRAPSPDLRVSDDELKRILTLVQEQKLTPDQAQELLKAMERREV